MSGTTPIRTIPSRTARFAPIVLLSILTVPILAALPASAAEHFVEARPNNTFVPSSITIEAGDTVTFTNTGGFHNVMATDGSFRCANGCDATGGDGDPAGNAWSVSLTFPSPDVVGYECEAHGAIGMTGTITVEPGAPDQPGVLSFATDSIALDESAGPFTLQVTRTGGDDGAVGVSYATSDGSATAGADYTMTGGTLFWPDGDDGVRQFQVPILDDGDDEPNETVNVMISSPTGGASLGTPTAATLTILDDDDPAPSNGSLGLVSSSFTAGEGIGTLSVSVARTGGTDGAVSVDYSTSDGSAETVFDYFSSFGTLDWADGEGGQKSFGVDIVDDTAEEGTETFNVALSDPTGGAALGTSSATVSIIDDDASAECVPSDTVLCLGEGDRFRVTVTYDAGNGDAGPGTTLPFDSRDGGIFYFSNANNPEMLVKVLDGCDVPGFDTYWVFYAATTNLGFELLVTDTQADVTRRYTNELGDPAEPIQDTDAFLTCP